MVSATIPLKMAIPNNQPNRSLSLSLTYPSNPSLSYSISEMPKTHSRSIQRSRPDDTKSTPVEKKKTQSRSYSISETSSAT
ncbi:hypothetical protein L1887_28065 [Cichorium endivia]|nr:hypothetical protein L1887_28065 [Cichorium endivia]